MIRKNNIKIVLKKKKSDNWQQINYKPSPLGKKEEETKNEDP